MRNIEREILAFFFIHLYRVAELKSHANYCLFCSSQNSYGMPVFWF